MVEPLREVFPSLGDYQVTSPRSEKYNCIAWAAGDATQWWWPDHGPGIYWPPEIPLEETIPAISAVFERLGYSACAHPDAEEGFERIALFADADGNPTHTASQLPGGRWTSKLGRGEDIEHALHDLDGMEYGRIVIVMRRAI